MKTRRIITAGNFFSTLTYGLGFSLFVAASDCSAETLNNAVKQVLERHPDIHTAQALLDATTEKVKQARSNYYPVIGASSQHSNVQGQRGAQDEDYTAARTDAFLRWSLFNGFVDQFSVTARQHDHAASAAQLERAHEQTALLVTETYLDVLRSSALLQHTETYIEGLEKLVGLIQVRAELGRSAEAERHQAHARAIQAHNQRAQLLARLRGAKFKYEQLTGQAPTDLEYPEFKLNLVNEPLDALLQRAMHDNPGLRAALKTIEAREAEMGIARGISLPTVSLELRKRLLSDVGSPAEFDTDASAQLSLNYELPLGGAAQSRHAEASHLKQAARAEAERIALELRTTLGELHESLKEAIDIAPRLHENVDATTHVVSAYGLQFNAGKRSLLDLLSAWSDRYQAYASVVDNWHQQTLTIARLHALGGKLRATVADL